MDRRLLLSALPLSLWPRGALAAPASSAPTAIRIIMTPGQPQAWVTLQIIQALYRQINEPMYVDMVPLARASKETASGMTDGELIRVAPYFVDNPRVVKVEPAVFAAEAVVFSLAGRNAMVRTRDDLVHYSLAYQRGQVFAQELIENHPAVTMTQTSAQLIRMLQAGRVDLVLLHRINGQYFVDRMGLRDVEVSPVLARNDYFHCLAARHARLAKRLGAAIVALKASGEFERIRNQAIADLAFQDISNFGGLPPPIN